MEIKIIWVLVCGLLIYAIIHEIKDSDHHYIDFVFTPGQKVKESMNKLEKSVGFESRTVKWRRTFIAAFLTTILLFYITDVPLTQKQLILFLIVIYGVYYANWNLYCSEVCNKVNGWSLKHIEVIKNSFLQTDTERTKVSLR